MIHPYRLEIAGTLVFAPLDLALETWRRWGELLSPNALDDWLIFVSALIVVRKLARRDAGAPVWWLFVCGGFLYRMDTVAIVDDESQVPPRCIRPKPSPTRRPSPPRAGDE